MRSITACFVFASTLIQPAVEGGALVCTFVVIRECFEAGEVVLTLLFVLTLQLAIELRLAIESGLVRSLIISLVLFVLDSITMLLGDCRDPGIFIGSFVDVELRWLEGLEKDVRADLETGELGWELSRGCALLDCALFCGEGG